VHQHYQRITDSSSPSNY